MLRKAGLLLVSGLLAALFAALLATTGCSTYRPFDSAGQLRGEYAQHLGAEGAAGVEVPFDLSPELRAEVERHLHRTSGERRSLRQVLDFIFDRFDLHYELAPTRNASETFRTRKGTCLSFVNLFVGIAREQGLAPFYVEVTDYQKWSSRQGMVVSQGHIVAGMYLDGQLETFDFLPYRPKGYRGFKPIDDRTAAAHYFNNLGAEALLAGDNTTARRYLAVATGIAPGFDKALNNLGVLLARDDRLEEALEVYRRGLESAPDSPILLTNMVRIYQRLGRGAEADQLAARIDETNATNPFFFVYLGEVALGRGDTGKALDYMARALRQDSELPEVHLGLVKVYLALGDMEKARHHLERALQLDATNAEAQRYARLMGPGAPPAPAAAPTPREEGARDRGD
jgi:tetratricopeptide (TPR) repeat protein